MTAMVKSELNIYIVTSLYIKHDSNYYVNMETWTKTIEYSNPANKRNINMIDKLKVRVKL